MNVAGYDSWKTTEPRQPSGRSYSSARRLARPDVDGNLWAVSILGRELGRGKTVVEAQTNAWKKFDDERGRQ